MKPNFALSLSFDGLRLMHRVSGGWNLVGQVALDDADVTAALARLRAAATALDPGTIQTKLLIPNDQIKYLALDTTRAEDDDVRAALHGATPYAVDELAYDFAKGGGRTYVAAVARETLEEAEQFATEHNFNPVSFAAVPEPFTYVGEAFFGAVSGHTVERDSEPVIVIGQAEVDIPDPDPQPVETASAQDSDAAPETAPETAPDTTQDTSADTAPPDEADPTPPEPQTDDATPDSDTVDQPDDTDDAPSDQSAEDEPPAPDAQDDAEIEDGSQAPDDQPATEPEPEAVGESDAVAALDVAEETPEQDSPSEEPDDAGDPADVPPAPVFASRLRADRSDGAPQPAQTPARSEPALTRAAPPDPAPLAVPTDRGTGAVPPVAAPSRSGVAGPVATPLTTDAPDLVDDTVAAPITGEAASALPPEAAVAAASLTVAPDPEDAPSDASDKGAATSAMGAVGGAVGGMFASRRMARAEAKTAAAPAKATETRAKFTVFGARKQPKPKPVVGGKPRFLGLILTAILLLFLLAIAAVAALSEDGFASWFGFGSDEVQVAAVPADQADPELPQTTTPEVVAVPTEPVAPSATDALATPTAPTGGQVLSPEEATRIYAATGVWQRAPRIPLVPRTTSIDALTLGSAPAPVLRVPASPLVSASSVAGDALIATPIDPPAPDATFNFDEDGLIIATPQGSATPDGVLIIAGRPPLEPPVRPGTVAPEITPQDQIAAVIPETAAPIDDAPEGVIVISGRPSIEPPIRPGTNEPAPAPQAEALANGAAPLLATDGLLVIAGSPPVLPPARPGTTTVPVAVAPAEPTPDTPALVPTPDAALPEGLNVIAGPPPVLPPARPGTLAPQNDAAIDSLTTDVTAALSTATAQIPTTDTPRPRARPASVVQAAVVLSNTPVLGPLTAAEAAAFRPLLRPAGLAPAQPPAPEPEPTVAVAPADPTLQIAPEIAAAVQAAVNRPNPIVNPTAQAVPVSSRPDPRPRNMARIVDRANQAAARAATQAAAVAPRTVAPSGPTAGSVAQNATLDNAINLRQINLIGIYGGTNDRRALVRLGNGRYVRVTVGDRLDGGRVTAISSGVLSYNKRGRAITLEVAG